MCSLWFNIRFGKRHLQIGRDGISFRYNSFWDTYPQTRMKWFAVYTFFGVHINV